MEAEAEGGLGIGVLEKERESLFVILLEQRPELEKLRRSGPDPDIENPNYDVVRIIRIRPEAGALNETEEVRGLSGVEVANAVWKDREDAGGAVEGLGPGGYEAGGEAAGDGSISVEDMGRRV
ncbi:hypothetical protein NL676_026450 [Syzygium grande]|nr:hypothetical protein NL676_026450 [Syzygium grande]